MVERLPLQAAAQTVAPTPGLWRAYRHELFKAVRQPFYVLMTLFPLILAGVVMVFLVVVKTLAGSPGALPPGGPSGAYDLGQGLFANNADAVLGTLANFYTILVIIGCALSVSNEYRWNTIKMLATRQPSRVKLVLAKCLFAATVIAASGAAFLVMWVSVALALKAFGNLPLTITALDAEAIGKSLHYFAITRLQILGLALLSVAITFRFRSLIGGLIVYVLYSSADIQVSRLGAAFANNRHLLDSFSGAAWLRPILELFAALNPYLLTSQIDRLSMSPQLILWTGGAAPDHAPNMQVAWSTPEWWAWLVVAVYVVGFSALAAWIFARRDITD